MRKPEKLICAQPKNYLDYKHRRLNAVLNNPAFGLEWGDAATLRSCIAAAELIAKTCEAESSLPRRCGVCGREFVPEPWKNKTRAVNKATCRSCLDAGKKARGYRCKGATGICERCGRTFRKNVGGQRICGDCQPESKKRKRREP